MAVLGVAPPNHVAQLPLAGNPIIAPETTYSIATAITIEVLSTFTTTIVAATDAFYESRSTSGFSSEPSHLPLVNDLVPHDSLISDINVSEQDHTSIISVSLQSISPSPYTPLPVERKCSSNILKNLFDFITLPFRHDHHDLVHSATSQYEDPSCSKADSIADNGQEHHDSPFWTNGQEQPELWTVEERSQRTVPDYVFEYAPYVHLFSGEEFWPCDIAEHIVHMTPHLNYTPIERMRDDRTLHNLHEINDFGRWTYLTSDDDVEQRPTWLGGDENIPDMSSFGPFSPHAEAKVLQARLFPSSSKQQARDSKETHDPSGRPSKGPPHPGGYSSAPAVLVVIPKEKGIVDAFWFYFYSYNLGNKVFNVRFGNHVGDWEHTVVRFQDGKPQYVFLSEHNFGEAYSYGAMEKIGKRPVTYSATGTHAMYATPGLHPYVLPWGLLHDQTDRGPLWDPLLNSHAYTYDLESSTLRASTRTPKAPTSWFNFAGRWGDKIYPMSDRRQYKFAGQYHYVTGPLGPRFKSLARKTACQGHGQCVIKHWLGGETFRDYPDDGDEDEPGDAIAAEQVMS